jgi:two-component system phosphate regulon sensor histidine kinase PhoR
MALSNRKVSAVAALIAAALTGLVLLQLYLLRNAMDQQEAAFDANVLSAMNSAVLGLADDEAVAAAIDIASSDTSRHELSVIAMMATGNAAECNPMDSAYDEDSTEVDVMKLREKQIRYYVPSPQRVVMRMHRLDDKTDSILTDSFLPTGTHHIVVDSSLAAEGSYQITMISDSGCSFIPLSGDVTLETDSSRYDLVRRVVTQLAGREIKPIEERVDTTRLKELLDNRLTKVGIDLEYAWGITADTGESFWLVSSKQHTDDLTRSQFRAQLFPHDLFPTRASLALFFPEAGSFLWWQSGPLLAATLLFVLIIVFCFTYAIRALIVQRRHAALMVDFVNNMTHEFKTPISTVALACEAIQRTDIIGDTDRVRSFSEMIQSENRRMRRQTEKILQMAALEESDYELKLEDVDVHSVITEALSAISLMVDKLQGQIESHMDATRHNIKADRVHVAAMINNLLDNALKYSPHHPHIIVRTRSTSDGLHVIVEDRGVGISADHVRRVFDKFYRVPSGNIHDVKGFGLGLSYVALMMKAHGGSVKLDSGPSRGTTVELWFPFKDHRD